MHRTPTHFPARYRATIMWTAICATIAAAVNVYELVKGLVS